jgi:hypothetical protein
MTASLSVHEVEGIVVRSYYPGNSHSVCLGFPRNDSREEVHIDLYGMNEERALAFLVAMSKVTGATEMTNVYTANGTIALQEYMTERAVHNALEVTNENAV